MTLTFETEGDTRIIVRRRFAAPPALVWRAHTEPALIQRWCTGPEGWTMPVCLCDPRPGGSFRYEWAKDGQGFYATGEFLSLEHPRRIVHVERMFLPDPTPENQVTTEFHPDGTGTRMVMVMQLPDAKTREIMLATGMMEGMEVSYARMDGQAFNLA